MTVVEYMRDVALHTVLGPYGIPIIGVQAARDAYEGDYRGVARGAAVEAGSLAMSYSMLKLLNHLQGPKYAMSYAELHKSMNPLRNLGVGAVVTSGSHRWSCGCRYGSHDSEAARPYAAYIPNCTDRSTIYWFGWAPPDIRT